AALNTLQSGQWLEFVALRAIVQATDGNLGAHLGTLESAGYVVVKKDFVGRKPRTRICLSRLGRAAFSRYVSTLQAILAPGSVGAHRRTRESAGYVVVKKDFVGRKPRTRICLSRLGREAFSRYVSTLQAILAPGSLGAEDADDG